MSQKKYYAMTRVKHSENGKFYERGEEVPVTHLDEDSIAMLVEQSVLREVVIEEPKPEPKRAQNLTKDEVKSDD